MIKNYVKVALRNMRKNSFYSFINVFGLTIGITGCLFIAIYIWDELSFDKFHEGHQSIYRVALTGKLSEQEISVASTSPPIAPTLIDEVSGVEDAIRMRSYYNDAIFRSEDRSFSEEDVWFTDENFFKFFSFKLIHGDKDQVLSKPNTVVLTEDLAIKYFGRVDVRGETLLVGNDKDMYEITGVSENTPHNSHIKFTALLSMATVYEQGHDYSQEWTNNGLLTYVRKSPELSVGELNNQLDLLVRKYIGPQLEKFFGTPFEQFLERGGKYEYWVFPLTDSRLYSKVEDAETRKGDIKYVYIFSAVGVFLLIIACINFMNLATARSMGRAKEVGLRKSLGSERKSMITQFLFESGMYVVIASVFSLLLVLLLFTAFNQLAGKELSMIVLLNPVFPISLLFLIVLVTMLAGSYPAFYLTAFNPVEVLKGQIRVGAGGGRIRSFLVVFQFILSIGLIISTIIVFQQLQFMQNKNLGFDKEHIIEVNNANRLTDNRKAFKTDLLQYSNIEQASYTNNTFPGVNNTTVFYKEGSPQEYLSGQYFADYEHAGAMDFKLKEGRWFSKDFSTDTAACVVNEALLKAFAIEEGLAATILKYEDDPDNPIRLKVIGIISDFNFESLKDPVRPMLVRLSEEGNNLLVRYSGSPGEAIDFIEEKWTAYAGDEPLAYAFLDDSFDRLFRAEQRMGRLFTVLTIITIFVACLGLYGLAAYTSERKTKEIGIRKTLGASSWSLTTLLSIQFTKLVAIAFLLATFPAYYFLSAWLEGFAYHVNMNWYVFVAAGVLSLVIAWATVSYQALKVSMTNPVRALKYE
jgi:putative ABC transport system permease protein